MRYVMFVSERVPKRLIPSEKKDCDSNDVKCKMAMIVSRKTIQVMQALASTEVIGKHIGQVDFQ
ncbi:hypothetical protein T10_1009 [Trichinella papuae]|uniref:Uncharacterized protein n=1 Tax=Trichinella papuae TaxID=268474 RepID=A0A0V1MH53_9BILA|nr:hypothetical protein T10_9706 [Trichinella papuae]KRZ71233.1 hypothetical protein T10_1009 [Trichinella papuae]